MRSADFKSILWILCTALVFVTNGAATTLQLYNPAPIYTRSGYWSLTINGQNAPVHAFDGYAYAHFSFGDGAVDITATSIQQTSITSFTTSPQKYGYNTAARVSGNSISLTMQTPQYIILKSTGVQELIILADPLETNIPPSSGTGIFNVVTQYGADASGNSLSTIALTNALQAAGARGQGSIIYVPPGVYLAGNLDLPSSTSLYLAAGAVIKFTGNRNDYRNDWHKDSQNLDGTEWIRTKFNSHDIKIYGRGTIDGIGKYAQTTGKFIAHLVVPMNTTRFVFDGPILRDGGSWTFMPTRSSYVLLDHVKVMNRMNIGENDAIGVQESQHVTVQNSIGISLDDSFSTKTWAGDGIAINWPGPPQALFNVTFINDLAWTHCYGFKVGQGVWENQQQVLVRGSTVYDAAVGLGVHHKWGSAAVSGVGFTDTVIEHLHGNNDGHQTWLAVFVQAGTAGIIGPIDAVSLWSIKVLTRGTSAALAMGVPGALVSDVRLRSIWFSDLGRNAVSLAEMSITSTSNSNGVVVVG
ncbi:pectin lyase fold/virulence factor [Crassisporium funariophilum]|nr:pectin lyase fold/virulence factor [Crassisporium funariophilum]